MDAKGEVGESHPVYNPDARCPKCGSENVSTLHRSDSHGSCRSHSVLQPHIDRSDRFKCSGCDDEHMDRTCQRCHYVWREEVLADA